MPQLTMSALAKAMERGVAYGLNSWLIKFELVEGNATGDPWYGSSSLYANPFAIRYQLRGMKKPAILTLADMAHGLSTTIHSKEFGKPVRAVFSGRYTDIDAAGLLRGILTGLQS